MTNELVEVGSDDWLFLAGGSNPFLSYLRGKQTLEPEVISAWKTLLQSRKDRLKDKGIQYLHLFAPEKATIYNDKLTPDVRVEWSHIARLADSANELFLDVVPYFRMQRKYLDLYHKTDSHWNFYGAFSAFQLAMAQLDKKVPGSILSSPIQRIDISWDLGGKLTPPVSEVSEIRDLSFRGRRVWENDLVREKERSGKPNEARLHVGSVVVFKNESAQNSERVVIFGDSFSEYRPHLLTAMFAEAFSEVHFVWSSAIDFEYIDLVKPNLVISELAERFMRVVPRDEISIEGIVKHQFEEYFGNDCPQDIRSIPSGADIQFIRGGVSKKIGPDIIIAGSMKCGTTILHDFLTCHENISPAKLKELHFFSLNYGRGADWYSSHFDDLAGVMKVDASPTYFDMTYGIALPSLIRAECPKAKVIVCLRDPVERAISHFRHLKEIVKAPEMNGLDMEKIFSGDLTQKYWRQFSSSMKYEVIKDILDFGMYSRKIAAFRSVFGDNLLLILNEDLWREPQKTMGMVFEHVGLNFVPSDAYERKDYVTRGQVVPERVRRSLRSFYSAEIELLAKDFGINFRDAMATD